MKLIAVLVLVIVLLVTVCAAGCTSTTTDQNTATPSGTQPPREGNIGVQQGNDKSSYISSQFSKDFNIVTPFKMTTNQYGNTVYNGVVKDTEKKLNPYLHNITIELTKNRADTKTRYAQWGSYILGTGLVKEFDYGDYMTFYDGSDMSHPYHEAYLEMHEPSSFLGTDVYNTYVYVNLGDTFVITLDYTTKLA